MATALGNRPVEQALLAVARLVASRAPEEVVFAATCEEIARGLGAAGASILRYTGDERALLVGTWRPDGMRGVPVNAELDFDRTNSAIGRVRATLRPARADTYEGVRGELPAVMRAIGLRSTVAAPVMVDEQAWGVVVASSAGDEPPPAGSEQHLVAFAELVALAVTDAQERRRLNDAQVRLVEAGDAARRRLERELHEGAHQHLISLTLKLRVARAQADPEVARLLDEAIGEAMETTAALRDLSRSLHPAVLVERGLAAALLALVSHSPASVHLRELPGRRFPATVETTAYLVVAEAVAGAAGELEVGIADGGDRVVAEVRGGGEPAAALRELGERIAALGGVLESEPGLVRATLPL